MRDKELESNICKALDAEMSGMRVSPYLQERILDNAIGGVKVKPKLTLGLVLAVVFILVTAAAVAVTVAFLAPQEVVEQVAIPMAQQNDKEWRIETDFSPEELATLIQALSENGFTLDENSRIMEAIRNGEGYDEEETIMAICREAFGGNIGEWTLAQQHWFWDVMIEIGWATENNVEVPGPDDLTEEEAKALMIAAIRAEYGEDLPLNDKNYFSIGYGYLGTPTERGETWLLNANPIVGAATGESAIYHVSLDKAGNIVELYGTPVYLPEITYEESLQNADFTLTEEEAVHIAAEGIHTQTGKDVPLEDPKQYRYVCDKQPGNHRWHINFISQTSDWGFCSTYVNDETHEVTIESADVYDVTADTILGRYRAQYGWYDTWTSEIWSEVAEKVHFMPATTMLGKVTKATPWIAWREGLLTRDEAEEQAFRQSGVKMGDVNCACLIDANPNPIWKFRLLPWDGTYEDSIVVEIDAVTGKMTDLDIYKSDHQDLEPSYHMFTLRSIWSRLEYEENGPLYTARLAVLHKFADNTFDMPEVDSLPIFDMRYWIPEINGNKVHFVSQWRDFPDYEVTLDENGMAIQVEEKESSGTEPIPDELNLESIDESLYGVNQIAQAEAMVKYGALSTLWPLEVQMEVYPYEERTVPRESEMTREEAIAFAKEQLPEEAKEYAENATVGAILYRLDVGLESEFTRWTIFFYEDPEQSTDAWRVTFVDKHPEDTEYSIDVKEPGDYGNG